MEHYTSERNTENKQYNHISGNNSLIERYNLTEEIKDWLRFFDGNVQLLKNKIFNHYTNFVIVEMYHSIFTAGTTEQFSFSKPSDYMKKMMEHSTDYIGDSNLMLKFQFLEDTLEEFYNNIESCKNQLDNNLTSIINCNTHEVLNLSLNNPFFAPEAISREVEITRLFMSVVRSHGSNTSHGKRYLVLKFRNKIKELVPEISKMTPKVFLDFYGSNPSFEVFVSLIDR